MSPSPPIKVAALIYPHVELVDMNGPIDVFLKANMVQSGLYQVYTVAATAAPVVSEDGVVSINPSFTLEKAPEPDIVLIPGIINGEADVAVVNWIKKWGEANKIIMSICIGAFTLARTGLLDGKRGTTHYQSIGDLHNKYPAIEIVKNVRFVQDANIISTGGITSGIDGALHLVEQRQGADFAQQVADILIYNREAPLPPFTILPPYYNS